MSSCGWSTVTAGAGAGKSQPSIVRLTARRPTRLRSEAGTDGTSGPAARLSLPARDRRDYERRVYQGQGTLPRGEIRVVPRGRRHRVRAQAADPGLVSRGRARAGPGAGRPVELGT